MRTSCTRPGTTLASRATVAYGRPVTVHGQLMSSAGQPLAGQPVDVLTAPDNSSGAFTQAAVLTTGPDGSWTTQLPAGPSRIIEASYPGSATILPASGQATVITPARVKLSSVTPDRTPWGSTVRITGQVLGGYVPASSKLLRLDLGIVGIAGLSKIQGIPNISPDGQFRTSYTFSRASGVVRFWLMVSSLTEADFPFAPAHSQRVMVTVGVPTPRATAHHRRDRHRDQRRLARRAAAKHHKHHRRDRQRHRRVQARRAAAAHNEHHASSSRSAAGSRSTSAMTVRDRGEHDYHWGRWRPSRPAIAGGVVAVAPSEHQRTTCRRSVHSTRYYIAAGLCGRWLACSP